MKIHPLGAINDDLQCSWASSNCWIGGKLIVVRHSCKDGLPSQYHFVVRIPGEGFIHIDVRHLIGEESTAPSLYGARQRDYFIGVLQGRFKSSQALIDWVGSQCLPVAHPGR